MPRLSNDIRDMTINHAHGIEAYKNKQAKKVRRVLRRAVKALGDDIRKLDAASITRKRKEELMRRLKELSRSYTGPEIERIRKELREFGVQEAESLRRTVDRAAPGLKAAGVKTKVPSASALWGAATSRPLTMEHGTSRMMQSFLNGIDRNLLRSLEESLQTSVATGESVRDAAKRFTGTEVRRGAADRSINSAESIVRTCINHMSSASRKRTFEENDDLVKGYQWVSTLDKRTSSICRYRDGRVWFFKEEDREKTRERKLEAEEYPPAHPNCRSTTIPVLYSWQELGIDAEEIDESTRESMDGQVSDKTTYNEWLSRQDASVQREVLGPTRYEMWKEGEIDIDQFYDPDGRELTLVELEKRGYDIERKSGD